MFGGKKTQHKVRERQKEGKRQKNNIYRSNVV